MGNDQQMKLLLNDKEILHFLLDFFCKNKKVYLFPECHFSLANSWALHHKKIIQYDKFTNKKFNKDKVLKSTLKELQKLVKVDLENYLKSVNEILNKRKNKFQFIIKNNLNEVIDCLGEDKIFELYKISKTQNFVKTVGFQLDSSASLIRREKFHNAKENCLLRNTVGNEQLLLTKIENNFPFYFIDSGYTNFIETNKKWHRLVKDHIHIGKFFDAPCDRLNNFTKFPIPWRISGEKILVIEPGHFAASIFKIDLQTWRYQIENKIRQFSDKPIIFREKHPKKIRQNLFQHLLDEDYYCLININSNAAVESVWAGIPVITLGKHITNSISVNQIECINELYRPNIGNWLAMLSYSQFTFDELMNGTANKILSRYHE